MGRILRELYRRLPVVRELNAIRSVLEGLRSRFQVVEAALVEDISRALLAQDRHQAPRSLNRYEFQVFSQGGEDGIVAEIFRRIGCGNRTFLEIGVGDGHENNTAFLLCQGWQGYWIEGGGKNAEAIQRNFKVPIHTLRLKFRPAHVTAENIEGILRSLDLVMEPDLVSIDVDRNTYWIWAALKAWRPRVVVVEYNAFFPPDFDWKVEYHGDRPWNGTSYFGGSLKALESLGREKGYSLVGCTLSGVNAFFVRGDLCATQFQEPFTAEFHYQPPRYFLARRRGKPPCFTDDP